MRETMDEGEERIGKNWNGEKKWIMLDLNSLLLHNFFLISAETRLEAQNSHISLYFFFISKNIYKKRRGVQPKVHKKYKRGSLRGRREAREKVWKTNYSRGKPTDCPSVKSKKKIMQKFFKRPHRIFKTFIITFPPNTPHKTQGNHLPHHCTPRATTSKQITP